MPDHSILGLNGVQAPLGFLLFCVNLSYNLGFFFVCLYFLGPGGFIFKCLLKLFEMFLSCMYCRFTDMKN